MCSFYERVQNDAEFEKIFSQTGSYLQHPEQALESHVLQVRIVPRKAWSSQALIDNGRKVCYDVFIG